MTELITTAQMRAIEQTAIESGAVTGLELMERAGQGAVEAVFEEFPELAVSPGTVVVLCGPGNNGGDGFVIARLLKELGWVVSTFLYGDAARLPADAQANHDCWAALGEVIPLTLQAKEAFFESGSGKTDLIVDALFGSGLARPLPRDLGLLIRDFSRLRDQQPPGISHAIRIVAVDCPSGLCLDSGRVLGDWPELLYAPKPFEADLTISFQWAKVGHYLRDGPAFCGTLAVKEIGL